MFNVAYPRKLITAERAASLVKSGMWIDYGMSLCMPVTIDEALAKRKNELHDVKARGLLSMRPLKIVTEEGADAAFSYASWHLSGLERRWADEGRCDYIPMAYRNKPEIYRKCLDVDIAFISAPPMDAQGYFNFSVANSATRAILETAKIVVVEVNNALPRCHGGFEECIHISEVGYIVEGGSHPMIELPSAPSTEVERRIAEHIVSQVKSGSTIQIGIGGIPNSVGQLLAETDLKDLGMHTEMLVDAYLVLHKSGKLTNAKKNIDKHKGVWSFCLGSKDLYEWVADNPGLASCPVNYTNSPEIMGRNDNLVTINCCIEADLFAQVSSESAGSRQISGTGGQLDFVHGSFISDGGKSFICMGSTYTDKKTGEMRSRILPVLPEGEIVTSPRSQIHQLVTEWGCVNLAGRTMKERCERIISIAHPDFRDNLSREAEKMGLLRRSQSK
ncbi:MAG: Butyryl-CoA:acetate CoA-transferase [Desulfovibrio sp.]